MDTHDIKQKIISLFKEKESFKYIKLDQDYFDLGISSLTIVELQVKVEAVVGASLETSRLMRFSTINEWVDAYVDQATQEPEVE